MGIVLKVEGRDVAFAGRGARGLSAADIARRDLGQPALTDQQALALYLTLAVSQLQPLAGVAGTGTAYTSTSPTAAEPDGQVYLLKPHVDSGAAPTLKVNALTARPLLTRAGVAIAAADLKAGVTYPVVRDGTAYRVLTIAQAELEQLLTSHDVTFPAVANWDQAFTDRADPPNTYGGVRQDDIHIGHAGSSSSMAQAMRDLRNAGGSFPRRHNLPNAQDIARADFLGILGVGQSYMTGQGGREPLSRTAHLDRVAASDVFTFGQSVRAASATAAVWNPMGGNAAPQPLVARGGFGATALDDATIAAGGYAVGWGETMLDGAALAFANMWTSDPRLPSKKFFVGTSAVGGRTIEQLSKNANARYYNAGLPGITYPDLWQRNVDWLNIFKAYCDSQGKIGAVFSVVLDQGQFNYKDENGGATDYATYLARLDLFRTELNTLIRATTGQRFDPFWFVNQTSGNWLNDTKQLSISRAHQALADANPGAVTLLGPTYDAVDNRDNSDGHLTSNGYRWVGERIGKAMWHVAVDGLVWEGVRPRVIRGYNRGSLGAVVYVGFQMMKPPIQIKNVYNGVVSTLYPAGGFQVSDGVGLTTIIAVRRVGGSTIAIYTDRPIDLSAFTVNLGDDTYHNGNTNIFDSYDVRSFSNYYFDASLNMEAIQNLSELVGKPYPSEIPASLFRIDVTNGEWIRT